MKFIYKAAAAVDDCLCEKEMRKGKHLYSIPIRMEMLIKYVSYSQENKAAQKKGIQCHFHNYKKNSFSNLWNERGMVVDEWEKLYVNVYLSGKIFC